MSIAPVVGVVRKVVRFAPVLVEVCSTAVAVEIGLRTRPFENVLAATTRIRRRRRSVRQVPNATVEKAIRIGYRLLPFEYTCLKHSLIFCRYGRRRGLPVELRIGVQKEEGVFAAHAWVEDGAGNVLTDPQDGFTPVPLPSATSGPRASD